MTLYLYNYQGLKLETGFGEMHTTFHCSNKARHHPFKKPVRLQQIGTKKGLEILYPLRDADTTIFFLKPVSFGSSVSDLLCTLRQHRGLGPLQL